MVISLVILFCFTFGCQQAEEAAKEQTVDVEADVVAINKINEDWNVAYNAGDVEKLVSFFTDDALRVPANEQALVGKEAIRKDFQLLFDQFTVEQKSVLEDVRVSGHLAYFRGSWTTINTPKAGGEPIELNGNYVSINQKQSDGTWKTIFNSWSTEQLILPDWLSSMVIPVIQDVIIMKNGDFINGKIKTEIFHIETSFGTIEIKREEIDQIHIKGTHQFFEDEIHTLEMSKFTGTIEEKSIEVILQSGQVLDLDKNKIHSLIMLTNRTSI